MHALVLILLLLLIMPAVLLLLFGVAIFQSAGAVLTIPRQFWEMAHDRRTRRNHALEHATVHVLEERFGPRHIDGRATPDGFVLYRVPFSPQEVLDAATEGCRRLSGGEHRLAIHPRCGTSALATTFLLSATFLAVLFFGKALSLGSVVAAFLLAVLMGKPLGRWLQKYVTTSPYVRTVSIEEVVPAMSPPVMLFGSLALGRAPAMNYLVCTHHAPEPIQVRIRKIGPPGSAR